MLTMPVAAKLQRQPTLSSRSPISGTPIADENLAAESKSEVAKLRSLGGNQRPTALAFAGKVGASPIPRSRRAPKRPPRVGVIDAAKEATPQRKMLMRPTRRMPNLSRITPIGSWQRAYVQL